MGDINFGRQLQPVRVIIQGGEQIDRQHWAQRIRGWLENQPCCTNQLPMLDAEAFTIYPDANND